MAYNIDDLLNLIYKKDNKTAGLLITKKTINMQNASGLTPLIVAVSSKNKKMVLHLLANGADISLKSKAGCTVWQFAGPDMKKFLSAAIEMVQKNPIRRPFIYNGYCDRVLSATYKYMANNPGHGRVD